MKQPKTVEPEQQPRHATGHAYDTVNAVVQRGTADYRAETAAQRQLQTAIANSPQLTAQRRAMESLDASPYLAAQRKTSPMQLQTAPEEEPLQGKFPVSQRMTEEEEPVQKRLAADSDATMQRVGEEEPVQGRFAVMQRMAEEEPLQRQSVSTETARSTKPSDAKTNRTGLPDQLKTGIESLSGVSLDGVKVHYNSSRPKQLNALAYAQGGNIHLAPGQERHLPHEAWHVVQQAQGRVAPIAQIKGQAVNTDDSLEREADVMGARAVEQQTVQTKTGDDATPVQARTASQLKDNRHAAGIHAIEDNPPLQRKSIGKLGGYTVEDSKYANGNWGNISTHLAGEWDQSNTSTPTGGHILNAMTAKWGASHANVANQRTAATNASGVYFIGAAPNANKVSGGTFDFFLVDYSVPSQKKQSKTKTSSFWPAGWNTNNLATILADSHQTTTGDVYASKAVTNYWFTWNSLGNSTTYPLARYGRMT